MWPVCQHRMRTLALASADRYHAWLARGADVYFFDADFSRVGQAYKSAKLAPDDWPITQKKR